jgi:hypothetical protein
VQRNGLAVSWCGRAHGLNVVPGPVIVKYFALQSDGAA